MVVSADIYINRCVVQLNVAIKQGHFKTTEKQGVVFNHEQRGRPVHSAWDRELPLDHPKRDYILRGVAEGFHITDPYKLTYYQEAENYKSATGKQHRELVEKKIKEELSNRRYKIVTKKPLLVSALGAIPKSGKSAIRIIHDASRPKNSSLNDHAWHEPFSYQRIQDAVDIIKPGYFLAKVDLSAAYRSVKIHESNHVATGLKWTFAKTSITITRGQTQLGVSMHPGRLYIHAQDIERYAPSTCPMASHLFLQGYA